MRLNIVNKYCSLNPTCPTKSRQSCKHETHRPQSLKPQQQMVKLLCEINLMLNISKLTTADQLTQTTVWIMLIKSQI